MGREMRGAQVMGGRRGDDYGLRYGLVKKIPKRSNDFNIP